MPGAATVGIGLAAVAGAGRTGGETGFLHAGMVAAVMEKLLVLVLVLVSWRRQRLDIISA